MVLKTLESPLDCKQIQPIHPKGDQSWIFFGRADAETEIPLLWPPDVNNWLIWKYPDAGKDLGQEEKGITGWDGWMASPTQWTWVWASSGIWWWTGKPGVLQSMGCQRVGHDRVTEVNYRRINNTFSQNISSITAIFLPSLWKHPPSFMKNNLTTLWWWCL